MKYLIKIFILSFIFFFVSCSSKNQREFRRQKKVIITGKILHLNNKKTLKIKVNKVSFDAKTIMPNIDSLGNFSVTFSNYIPSDISIEYGSIFYVITNPGDSLHIIFNGQKKDLLQTIKFSGSSSKSNQDLAAFQEMYFANKLNNDYSSQLKALKNYDAEKYLAFCDSVRTAKDKIYKKFTEEYSPNEEVKNWITTFLENDFYYSLFLYTPMHIRLNNIKTVKVELPLIYRNKLNEIFPLKRSMLISTAAINSFMNYYYPTCVFNSVKEHYGKSVSDSLLIAGINKLVPSNLARQLILTYKLGQDLNFLRIDYFEKHKREISNLVKEPYLKQPLFNLFYKTKNELENPRFVPDAILNNYSGLSEKAIMDSVLYKNKGRVIYVDFWATWCGPCILEMQNSKELRKELKNKKVAFVYMCIWSKVNDWKAMLSKLQLEGQQYFLNKKQSKEFSKAFHIIGVPDYLLINEKGTIIEKGYNLTPNIAKGKIKLLLQ